MEEPVEDERKEEDDVEVGDVVGFVESVGSGKSKPVADLFTGSTFKRLNDVERRVRVIVAFYKSGREE